MTKAGAYEKALRLGFKRDFSLVDKIYHPDYKSYDYRTGIEANIEDDKVIVSSRNQTTTIGPFKTIFEDENFGPSKPSAVIIFLNNDLLKILSPNLI